MALLALREPTDLDKMANDDLVFYLDGVTIFTVCAIGLAVNAAAICLLCRQKTSSIFVKLMISLVTYDLIYVFLFATCFSLPILAKSFKGKFLNQTIKQQTKILICEHIVNNNNLKLDLNKKFKSKMAYRQSAIGILIM